MIRPFTVLCALLAGASGMYLYTEKHHTTVLDQRISRLVQDTQHIRERTAMLRTEWALLNQPDRLQTLAARYLPQLRPLEPGQFVQMSALSQHLSPIVPAPASAPSAAPEMVDAAPPARMPDASVMLASSAPSMIDPAQPARPLLAATPAMARALLPASDDHPAAKRRLVVPEPHAEHHPAARAMRLAASSHHASAVRRASFAPVADRIRAAPHRPPQAAVAMTRMVSARLASWRVASPPRPALRQQEAVASSLGASSLGYAGRTLPAPVPVMN